MNKRKWGRQQTLTVAVAGMAVGLGGYWYAKNFLGPKLDTPSPLAIWPLPGAKQTKLASGVTHWLATDPADGTTVDFFDFDFGANPNLRFEIKDQDEDDVKPFDNDVLWWDRDAATVTRELNKSGRGPVLAAWNGAFFGYDKKSPEDDAFHLSPVVLNGKVLYNTGNHRWTFGVKYNNGKPDWKVFFKPGRPVMEKEFDWAAGSVQCLVKEGQPLKLEPFPKPLQGFKPQPVPSSPEEAGHIPGFDHMRSTRASLGWSRDNQHLYVLFVKEMDDEASSIQDVADRKLDTGGWMVSDLQQFWLKQGAYTAINSDAGDAGQLTFRRAGGGYTYLPPRPVYPGMRLDVDQNLTGAPPKGGALMYFFVREGSRNPGPNEP